MVKMDPIGEPLSLAQRKLWEAFGLLNAALFEAKREHQQVTERRIEMTIDLLAKTIDDGVTKASEAHDKETRA